MVALTKHHTPRVWKSKEKVSEILCTIDADWASLTGRGKG